MTPVLLIWACLVVLFSNWVSAVEELDNGHSSQEQHQLRHRASSKNVNHRNQSVPSAVSVQAATCGKSAKTGPSPDVFWINLDKSHERRDLFERELARVGLLMGASRIRALTPHMVLVPDELKVPHDCRMLDPKNYMSLPELKKRPSGKVFVEALCGRPRNNKKELAVTASHLQALRTAVNSGSDSPYALILEDDMEFGFDIDFHALAASAPPDFAILQLITSNDGNLKYLWKKFTESGGRVLWEKREDFTDFWCAGAYLINKAILRPVIERIAKKITPTGWVGLSVVAGYNCAPLFCCERYNVDTHERNVLRASFDFNNQSSYTVRSNLLNPACVRAPRGYQADHFIFELARPYAYTLTLPLFRSAQTGDNSTVHQEQVQWHEPAFRSIREFHSLLNGGKAPLPTFAQTC
jgi:GR25 family glycosyltransferase involved in LPS biosynthesis